MSRLRWLAGGNTVVSFVMFFIHITVMMLHCHFLLGVPFLFSWFTLPAVHWFWIFQKRNNLNRLTLFRGLKPGSNRVDFPVGKSWNSMKYSTIEEILMISLTFEDIHTLPLLARGKWGGGEMGKNGEKLVFPHISLTCLMKILKF